MYVILDNISPMHAVMHILVNVISLHTYAVMMVSTVEAWFRCCLMLHVFEVVYRLICLNLDHAQNRQLREAFEIIVMIDAVMYEL